MKNELLIIFVKNPVAGKVKSRLAKSIGSDNALHIYKLLLRHTHSVACRVDTDVQVWYSSQIDRTDLWEEGDFVKYLQKGNNLGQRMAYAIHKGFSDGYERIAIIGSDCPELTPSNIKNAFSNLDDSDCVIGPASDGGYYLLGLRRFLPGIFEGIEWSEGSVLDDTLTTLEQQKISVKLLQELNDIDTIDDLRQSGLKIDAL